MSDLDEKWREFLESGKARWMPGMLNGNDGTRYIAGEQWAWDDPLRHHAKGIDNNDWPDLTDPATLGCLLALVREAWGDPRAQLYVMEDADGREGWGLVLERGEGVGPFAETEAEALVAALEAAPCQQEE